MQKLNAKTLKQMLDRKEDVHVVNVLPPEQFDKKHIPGSINVPAKDSSFTKRVEQIVDSKSGKVVVYCASESCDASPTAAKKLEQDGFSNVYDFTGGVEAWEEAKYPLAGSAR